MIAPVWLIAEREFRTYVATLSFWAALVIGPLAVGGGLMLAQGTHRPATPAAIHLAGNDRAILQSARAALDEASGLEGRQYVYDRNGAELAIAAPAQTTLKLAFAPGFPLSESGRALVARTLERDAARRAAPKAVLTVDAIASAKVPPKLDAASVSRFVLMMMLWLTLTGSLGMLLQTVARERATRSLESLLAAASPWQIMSGKLTGVGAVSLLVLASWLGSSVALASFAPQVGLAPAVLAQFASPALLLRAGVIYLLAYTFYGSITVALGAMARDSASAQNLSRPMFVLLVVVFFVALGQTVGGPLQSASWLLYVPPFTPFLLLIYPAGVIPLAGQIVMFALLLSSAILAACLAAGRFSLSPQKQWQFLPSD